MANFASPKSPGRDLSQPKTPAVSSSTPSKAEFTGTGKKTMGNPSPSSGRDFVSGTPREFSSQLAFTSKGSHVLKDAMNNQRRYNLPATANPGPEGMSQSATKKAA